MDLHQHQHGNFGDGTTSTQTSPTKIYNTPGTYTVTLTATNSGGSSSINKTITVTGTTPGGQGTYEAETALLGVAAGAQAGTTAPTVGNSAPGHTGSGYVGFFGEGGQSVKWQTGNNPIVIAAAGSHRLSFRYQKGDSAVSASTSRELYIDNTLVTTLVFPATSNDWAAGSWQTISYDHTWASSGNKSVELRIPLALTQSYMDVDRVDVTPLTAAAPPQANFTASKTTATVGEVISFNNTSTGGPTNFRWEYGDGQILNGSTQNVTHAYGAAGLYSVKLTVSNDNGSTSKTITVTVNAVTPPTPPTPDPVATPLAYYKFIAGTGAAQEYLLSDVSRRNVTFSRKEGASASVTMKGESALSGVITELVTDIKVTRNDELYFRGRVGPSNDVGDPLNQNVTFAAIDYRKKLGTRTMRDTDILDFIDTDQGNIAWSLINTVQTRPNGDDGIRQGLYATGTTKDYSIEPGASVEEAINLIANATDGFDWEVDPFLKFNTFHPERGTAKDVVLDYGGAFGYYSRTFDFENYANTLWATATTGVDPVWVEAANIAQRPEGRWERSAAWPDAAAQETHNDNSLWLLEQAINHKYTYEVTLAPGFWLGKGHFWLGDIINLQIIHGRLNIREPRKVETISIDLDDEGTETVKVSLS